MSDSRFPIHPRLGVLLLSSVVVAISLMTSGCVTLGRKGCYGEYEYLKNTNIPKDKGTIAVTFAQGCAHQPQTEWRLYSEDAPEDWKPVRNFAHPKWYSRAAKTWGIEFRTKNRRGLLQVCDEPPPSRLVPILEQQQLRIPIDYK
jgi:hypothetical protein